MTTLDFIGGSLCSSITAQPFLCISHSLSNILKWKDEIISQRRPFLLHCERFYAIVPHLWRHYKQIQALKGNTLTGPDNRGDAEVCTSVLSLFFLYTWTQRDLTVPCLVMRSNQLTGSSCENVLNFTSVLQHSKAYSKAYVKIWKWKSVIKN